ncbi:MAG: patatin-like phospholipase family protein [Aggregatilineales bacterium]
MTMTPLRNNAALAIDGGGIRGLIVARALVALEQELGGGPLIEHPQIKILAGTSTGAIITAGIAIGMKAADIANLYTTLGQKVFPPVAPSWLPTGLQDGEKALKLLFQPSLYPNSEIIALLRQTIEDATGNPDLTLHELNVRLGPEKVLICTVVNIIERQTHFLKSYKSKYGEWKLWEAVLASSSAPLALPVFFHADPTGKPAYYTDGGVGSYGNPGYVAGHEAIEFRGYPAQEVSVLSFGTGRVDAANFERERGVPSNWHAINWAINAPVLLTDDANRAQSIELIDAFSAQGLDFRRFQVSLQKEINGDDFADNATYTLMQTLGERLGNQLHNNQYAPNADPQFDPEGLYFTLQQIKADRSALSSGHSEPG